jgi:hypothetical protein
MRRSNEINIGGQVTTEIYHPSHSLCHKRNQGLANHKIRIASILTLFALSSARPHDSYYETEAPALTPSSNRGLSLAFVEGEMLSEFSAESITGKAQARVKNNALVVTYPKGSFKSPSTGGFQFISRPIPESDEMNLSYSIDVPADFDFVKG